jgi:hypothetical protein
VGEESQRKKRWKRERLPQKRGITKEKEVEASGLTATGSKEKEVEKAAAATAHSSAFEKHRTLIFQRVSMEKALPYGMSGITEDVAKCSVSASVKNHRCTC